MPASIVGIEATGASHYWARLLSDIGHQVKIIPAAYVKPFVRRNKTDASDAAAICEALGRPDMHFVPIKSVEQQAVLSGHRVRQMLIQQRTMTGNAIRGHLAEFGVVEREGIKRVCHLCATIMNSAGGLPDAVILPLRPAVETFQQIEASISSIDQQIIAHFRKSEDVLRLATIPGIGPLTASALSASVVDISSFKSGRSLAAWLGLTPRQHASGGERRKLGISKRGNSYIRRLLVSGAASVIIRTHRKSDSLSIWVRTLLHNKPFGVVAVALANKLARIAWALLRHGGIYQAR